MAAEVPVLVTAGLGHATREAAYGAEPAVLLKALAPRDSEVALQGIALPPAALAQRAGVYVQPTTLQIVELSFRDGKLFAGRQGGPALVPLAGDRFRITGQPFELVFAADDPRAFERRPLGGGRGTRFEWRAPVTPSPGAFASYAGTYYSDEVQATYRVVAYDSLITLRTGTSAPIDARPAFADTFVGGGYAIQFRRTGRSITGFDVTNGRMRRVHFERIAGAGR